MKKSVFLKLFIPVIFVGFVFCALAQKSNLPACDNEVLHKVKTAMLCKQRYSWEHGTAMQGMLEIGDTAALILLAMESIQRSTPDGRLSMVGSDMNIADTGVNGIGVLAAYKITGDEKFKKAAQAQYEYLKKPESKNAKGVIYHNNKSKVIFSDNMFMVAPFLAQMGDYDEAIFQIEGIRDVLWNKEKKLFHHIRIQETGEFKDRSFWGGGNGWCAAAMVQVINLLPPERKEEKQKLIEYCTDLLDGCISNQLPGGLLYDKITEPDFEESTLPAMLAYSIYSAVKSGWLNKSYLIPADKMRRAVYANIDKYGLLQNASSAPRFNSPGTSTEGQAFFLMMEGAFRKLTIKKQIVLFGGTSTKEWKDLKSDEFPKQGWVVKEGILTVLPKTEKQEGGHDILTKEQFSDFELELEVRLSEGANSGVKYMVVDTYPGKKGQYLGLEYQLIDNEKHADALLGRNGNRKMATLYDVLPARENIEINPPGEWNEIKIVVNKNKVEHWLNGKRAVVYDRKSDCFRELVRLSKYNELKNFGEQEKGHVLLQGHGNEVSFRNIKITTW